MEKIVYFNRVTKVMVLMAFLTSHFSFLTAYGQTAQQVLDKTAGVVSYKKGYRHLSPSAVSSMAVRVGR